MRWPAAYLARCARPCRHEQLWVQVGKGLFERLSDMAAGAAVVVVALQEIEVGGGSVAMAAAKDVLMKRQQVGPGPLRHSFGCCACGARGLHLADAVHLLSPCNCDWCGRSGAITMRRHGRQQCRQRWEVRPPGPASACASSLACSSWCLRAHTCRRALPSCQLGA